jgi:hypothetical protein
MVAEYTPRPGEKDHWDCEMLAERMKSELFEPPINMLFVDARGEVARVVFRWCDHGKKGSVQNPPLSRFIERAATRPGLFSRGISTVSGSVRPGLYRSIDVRMMGITNPPSRSRSKISRICFAVSLTSIA